jgi:glutathione S-transferase
MFKPDELPMQREIRKRMNVTLYGAEGSGSIAVEVALTLLNVPYDLIEGATQVPTLVFPDGEIMTESAAILVTVVSRFGPWRNRFYEAAPKLAPVVRRVDAEPRLVEFWSLRFPFDEVGSSRHRAQETTERRTRIAFGVPRVD